MSDERSFEAALSLFQHRLYKTMGKAKLRAVALGGSATDIERAFYDALQKADLDKLMACWADEDEIVCVHPGGVRLVGALEIRKSFESIFSGGSMHVNVLSVKKVPPADLTMDKGTVLMTSVSKKNPVPAGTELFGN